MLRRSLSLWVFGLIALALATKPSTASAQGPPPCFTCNYSEESGVSCFDRAISGHTQCTITYTQTGISCDAGQGSACTYHAFLSPDGTSRPKAVALSVGFAMFKSASDQWVANGDGVMILRHCDGSILNRNYSKVAAEQRRAQTTRLSL
jgi:hypothetical protein